MKKYMVKESQYKPLENKIIGLELLKSNGPKKPNKPKKPSTRDLLIEFIREQRNHNTKIDSRLDRLETEIKGINTRIDNLVKLNNLKE